MSIYRFIYPSVRTCRSETEISNLFERHMKTLIDEKKRMINEIIEWENNLIRRIQENVHRQKQLLEQQCQNQLEYLKTKRQEYVDTALIYEERNDREEVRQLLEQCHSLKFQLTSIEYPEQMIPFAQIQTFEEKPMMYDSLQTSTQSNSTLIQRNFTENASLLIKLPSTCINQLKTENDNQISNATADKCPACFVRFSSTMGTDERSKHVNQHFND